MNTIPNRIWTEVRVYPLSAAAHLRAALMQYHEAIEIDNKASLIYNATNDIILVVYFYCTPIENPPIFQSFDDIPYLTSFVPAGIRTVYDLVQAVASVNKAEPTMYAFILTTNLNNFNANITPPVTNSAPCPAVPALKSTKPLNTPTPSRPKPSRM